MIKPGKPFWIAVDPTPGGQIVMDSKPMRKIDGYFRTAFERDLPDAPYHEDMDRLLTEYAPKLLRGMQVRVQIVAVPGCIRSKKAKASGGKSK